MDKNFSLKEKIGQHFIFGVNQQNIEDIIYLIKYHFIGGVILYKKNYTSYDEMKNIIKRLKNANKDNKLPLFIAIDQEFGKVNRMPKDIVPMRNITDVSKEDSKLVIDFANITGKILYQSGINMNFAPVLDIDNHSESKVLHKRCFYGDEESIIQDGKLYIDTIKKQKIISVPKHFPGHGISTKDSHFMIPYVRNYQIILDKHMRPFEALYKDMDAIMIGHFIIKKISNMLPTSISNGFIEKYLRPKFDGLIITDEVSMLKRNPLWLYFKKYLLKAKVDLLLVKIKNRHEAIKYLDRYQKIFDETFLNESLERIIKVKEKYNLGDDVIQKLNVDKLNKEIEKLNAKVDYN